VGKDVQIKGRQYYNNNPTSEGERKLIGLFFDMLAEKGLPKQIYWVVIRVQALKR